MPRPGPRRVYFGARLLTPDEHESVLKLAEVETGGNLSEMIRTLVLEAIAIRACQRGSVRDELAAAFRSSPGEERPGDRTPGEIADLVLAVLSQR